MNKRSYRLFAEDIQEAMDKIERYIEGLGMVPWAVI